MEQVYSYNPGAHTVWRHYVFMGNLKNMLDCSSLELGLQDSYSNEIL